MKTTVLISLLAALMSFQSSIQCVASGTPHPDVKPDITIILTRYYSPDYIEELRGRLRKFIVTRAIAGTHFHLIDGTTETTIVDFDIPDLMWGTGDDQIKLEKLVVPIRKLQRWFDQVATNGQPSKLKGSAAVDWPGNLRLFGSSQISPRSIVIFGSPLIIGTNETGFNMEGGFFPTDAMLFQPIEQCPYGILERGNALAGATLHFVVPSEGIWYSPPFRERVQRFISLFAQYQSATLATLGADIDKALEKALTGGLPPVAPYHIDTAQTKAEMLRIVRTNEFETVQVTPSEVNWNTFRVPVSPTEAGIVRRVGQEAAGKTAIGIMWAEHVDLDLYVWPDVDQGDDFVFYGRPNDGKAVHLHDYQDATDVDYETVLVDPTIGLKRIRAWVSFYAGQAVGTNVTGKFIVCYGGKTNLSSFSIPANTGNHGQDVQGRKASRFWTELNLQEVIGERAVFNP